jgi:hypothetical protein
MGELVTTHNQIDKQIIELSELFFDMRPIVREFEALNSDLGAEENNKQEEKIKAIFIEVDNILEELRTTKPEDLTNLEDIAYCNRLLSLLNIMLKSDFSMFFQVQISFVVKNIIDIMISLYDYFYLPSESRSSPRRKTMSTERFKQSEPLKSASKILPNSPYAYTTEGF